MITRKLGLTVGFALVVGAFISIFLPENEEKAIEKLFNEVNFQGSELRVASERLVMTRERLDAGQGILAEQPVLKAEADQLVPQIDQQLGQVVEWVVEFGSPPQDSRKEWLITQRERVAQLLEGTQTIDRKGRILLGDPGAN